MILWIFYDILDINIAGIPYIPSPYPYVFLWTPSKALVRSSNLGYMGLYVLLLPPGWTAGIRYDPLRLQVYVSICVYTECAYSSST